MDDPFELDRFLAAQSGVYARARAELAQGRKQSHWMWFIFPQILGLGLSPMAERYAIRSRQEARAYLAHPVLGERLAECTSLACKHSGNPVGSIFGSPDDLKFRSSMTLFHAVSGGVEFSRALDLFFDGEADPMTLRLLGKEAGT